MPLEDYHKIWNESWKFFKHYYSNLPETVEGWDEVIRIMQEMQNRHKEHEGFARNIVVLAYRELAKEWNRREQENERRNT